MAATTVISKTQTHVLNILNSIKNGQFFSVTFTKRNSQDIRVMNCRTGVHQHLKGGSARYKAESYDLVSVWDPKAHADTGHGYRQIPLEGITEIKAMGQTWEFV